MTDEESAAQWMRDVLTGKVLLDVTDGEMPLTARTDPNYHPNYKRNYRTQNSDKIRNYQRIYRTENRDKLVADKQELRKVRKEQ